MDARQLDQIVQEAHRRLGIPPGMAATATYRVPPLAAPLNAGIPTPASPIQWRSDVLVIGLFAQVLTAVDADAARTQFRIQTGEDVDFIRNGQTGDFMSILAAVGKQRNWFPLWIRATRNIPWVVTWNVVTGAAVTPDMWLTVLEFYPDAAQ